MNRSSNWNETEISILNMLHTMYSNNNNIMDRLLTSNQEILTIIEQIINNNVDSPISNRTSRTSRTRYSRNNIPLGRSNTNDLGNILF